MQVNINAISYEEIVQFLKYAQTVGDSKHRRLARALQDARLSDGETVENIIETKYWHGRFKRLANAIGYGDMRIMDIYKVTDDILYDIHTGRNWISDFKVLATSDYGITAMGQLVTLGQAILGMATQLCPMETGRLRQSGTLLVYDNYIVIYFDCPYATYVHDDLNKHHNIGQAKFLEVAMQQMLPNRQVWVEHEGENIVWCSISINYGVRYGHYN